jgi:hypothetical protein
MKKLLSTIHQATRETDVKGWYHFHKIIGVIYTEFDNNHIENILNKMKTSLQGILIPEHRPLISVSHIVFPEDLNMGKNKFLNVSAA